MLLKYLSITVLAVGVFISSGISSAELSDGLVSAWPFDDGNPKDYVGSNHGQIKGGVEVVDGKFGKAYRFNGADGHIQIPHDQSMEVIATPLRFQLGSTLKLAFMVTLGLSPKAKDRVGPSSTPSKSP
jgi:hypothetical protein